jgi:hypothetical protein
MSKRKIINLKEKFNGVSETKESLEILRDLSPSNLALLRGILLRASLESLQDYYTYGFIDGIQQVSVPVEEVEEALNMECGFLKENYVLGKMEESEGNLAFFYPIGMILESVLPNDLTVLEGRSLNFDGDDIYILFKVVQD